MKSKLQGYDSVQSLILAEAARLFTRQGVHGSSLNDIASAAKLAKGTLYYYYPAKEEIVADVARAQGDWVSDVLLDWAESLNRESDPAQALYDLVSALVDDPFHRKLHGVLLAESCLEDPLLRELTRPMQETWTLTLEVGALKLQSAAARRIRERASAFFPLLLGYMLKPQVTKGDKHAFVAIFLG